MQEKILIIEDDPNLRENTSELLELSGFEVALAKNGLEGLEKARDFKPDLILCDIMMPELDGYGVLRALENNKDLTGVPFVFLTARSGKSDFRTAMDLGADDYLTKPFTGEELLRVVNSRLRKNKELKKKFELSAGELDKRIRENISLQDISLFSEHREVKNYSKKEFVYMEGDTARYLHVLTSGKVKLFKSNDLGKELITSILKEGDVFGYMALLEDERQKESVVAIDKCEIALIPKYEFFKLIHSNNGLALKFVKCISHRLSISEENLLKLAYDSARKRVANAIILLSSKYKDPLKNYFPAHRENLSGIAGLSPESISRNISEFRDEGLIETDNYLIRISNMEKLEKIRN